MWTRSTPVVLIVVLSGFLLACAGPVSFAHRQYSPPGERLITDEEIARSGATTAWEAVQRTATFMSTTHDRSGQPSRMWRRGRGSIVLREVPLVVVDGVESADLGVLATIPAFRVAWIRILTGSASTARFGTSGGAGAVIVQTRGAEGEKNLARR